MTESVFGPGQIGQLQGALLDLLSDLQLGGDLGVLLVTLASGGIMLLLARVTDELVRLVLRVVIQRVTKDKDKERAEVWQTALHRHTLARRSAHLSGALVIYVLTPYGLSAYPAAADVLRDLVEAYVIFVIMLALNAFLRAAAEVMRDDSLKIGVPPQFVSQTLQLGVWIVGGVLIISVVTDLPVGALITGMAGMTAVLVIVFRDSLLGYVAGVQIVNNDLVREGDWIEVPKYGANGKVFDIGLITVKVRNFDNTLASVPSYALISDGFRNWRGMQLSGARRIKRSIRVNLADVAFCTDEALARLRQCSAPGIDPDVLHEAIARTVATEEDEEAAPVTNVALYCEYLREHLRRHPQIRHDLYVMVLENPRMNHGEFSELTAEALRYDYYQLK